MRDVAAGEDRRVAGAQVAELARREAVRFQLVRVGGDVDDGREPGMRDRAVVALEEVLAGDLPVRVQLELRPETELERIDVQHFRDLRRHRPERLRERRRIDVRIDEHERAPRVERERDERQLLVLEVELPVRSRRRAKLAVEPVRPRVVAALQRLAPAAPMGDDRAAMAADVQKRAQLIITRARHHYRRASGHGREERAGVGRLTLVADVLPGPREDALLLEAKDLGVRVPVPGKGPLHAERLVSCAWPSRRPGS